jgi:hypothetical protein
MVYSFHFRANKSIHIAQRSASPALASPRSTLQGPHLAPPITKQSDPATSLPQILQVHGIHQIVLFPESDVVRKQRVPMSLEGEVEDVGEMGVVDVRKDAEELFVDVFRRAREGRGKVSS